VHFPLGTPMDSLSAPTDDLYPTLYIAIFKIYREHVYRGLQSNDEVVNKVLL